MEAFALDELGKPGSLRDLPVPEPAEGELLVRVAAAGLNPFDNSVIQGRLEGRMEHRFPLIPGVDASGTVEAVGEGVIGWSVGDEVFGSVGKSYLGGGTVAEFATMAAGTIAGKPASIEHAAAAAVPVAGVTALIMVEAIAPVEGAVVVAIGATGGVGSFLVQLTTKRGARVVAVCSAENADYARRLGGADVIDYAAGDVVEAVRSRYPEGIDAIADMHGDKEIVAGLAEHVRPGGHVASAVGSADEEELARRGIGATNVFGKVETERLEALVGMLERGELSSPELHLYPMDAAGDAFAVLATRHVRGKLIVTIS